MPWALERTQSGKPCHAYRMPRNGPGWLALKGVRVTDDPATAAFAMTYVELSAAERCGDKSQAHDVPRPLHTPRTEEQLEGPAPLGRPLNCSLAARGVRCVVRARQLADSHAVGCRREAHASGRGPREGEKGARGLQRRRRACFSSTQTRARHPPHLRFHRRDDWAVGEEAVR